MGRGAGTTVETRWRRHAVPDIVLGERQQDSLRRLLALEATPGSLPPGVLLDIIDRLVPSDCIVVSLSDSTGCVVDHVMLSARALPADDPQVCDGPLMLGLVHQGTHPVERQVLRHFGVTDGVTLGFRCGPDHVVQLSMDRYGQTFSDSDMAMRLSPIAASTSFIARPSTDTLSLIACIAALPVA